VDPGEKKAIFSRRKSTQCQMAETTSLTKSEVRIAISKYLNIRKAPGYELDRY